MGILITHFLIKVFEEEKKGIQYIFCKVVKGNMKIYPPPQKKKSAMFENKIEFTIFFNQNYIGQTILAV